MENIYRPRQRTRVFWAHSVRQRPTLWRRANLVMGWQPPNMEHRSRQARRGPGRQKRTFQFETCASFYPH